MCVAFAGEVMLCGRSKTPREVLIKVAECQSGFGISWNSSEADEVSSYLLEVKIIREG